MRLIDADKLKQNLESLVVGGEKAIKETTSGNNWIDGIHTAYREIDDAPTVERPVATFEFYRDDMYAGGWYLRCTSCKWHFSGKGFLFLDHENYCPHCGAKIKRPKEGDQNDRQ